MTLYVYTLSYTYIHFLNVTHTHSLSLSHTHTQAWSEKESHYREDEWRRGVRDRERFMEGWRAR